MKSRFYAILFFLVAVVGANAQDIHFSQYYLSPLTLNPAMTGNFNGLIRIGGIYRNQYPGVGGVKTYYSTPSVAVDASLLKNIIKNGALGVGIAFVNDQQAQKVFNSNRILFSVAYNMSFAKKRVQLGLGFQGGVNISKLDNSKFRFHDGYNPDLTYDETQAGESFANQTLITENVNMGLFLQVAFTEKIRFYNGYSLMNISRQKDQFLSGSNARRPMRHVIHGGLEFDIKDQAVIIPGYLVQLQAKALEANFGVMAGVHVIRDPEKRATVYVGMHYRHSESSIIPKIGFEWKGFRVGFAYDAVVGKLQKDAKAANGKYPQSFEVALSYIFNLSTPKENNWLFNPRY